MLFKFVAVTGICQSLALRPRTSSAAISGLIGEVGDIVSDIAHAEGGLRALKKASAALAQIGNATEHMSDDDEALLRSVITLVEDTIYLSMDEAQEADETSLTNQINDVTACNTAIAGRQAGPDGDLYLLQQLSEGAQHSLDDEQNEVTQKTEANNSQWTQFNNHMQLISDSPTCLPLPDRTSTALEPFFESSAYATWFALQQADFQEEHNAWKDTDAALTSAINEYNIQLAVRDADYCDYSIALTSGCASFDTCYATEADEYSAVLVPRIQADMTQRQETYKAGETLIHQINYLLADVTDQTTPAINTARYEMEFPPLPPKGACDLTTLEDPMYVPSVVCTTLTPDYASRPMTVMSEQCANYDDILPGNAIGTGSYTIVAVIDWSNADVGGTEMSDRQWLLSLGQYSWGSPLWLWRPWEALDSIQFGIWSGGGGDFAHVTQGSIYGVATLASTYDSATRIWSMYIDGVFHDSVVTDSDVQNGQLAAGTYHAAGGKDFTGCIRGVDIYRSSLSSAQVSQASQVLRQSINM